MTVAFGPIGKGKSLALPNGFRDGSAVSHLGFKDAPMTTRSVILTGKTFIADRVLSVVVALRVLVLSVVVVIITSPRERLIS